MSAAAQGDFVKIAVTDNGKGIAPKRIPLLFELCKSRDSANNRIGKSTGNSLGLFIYKHIVEAQAIASGSKAAGTTVCFTLPKVPESTSLHAISL